MKPSTYRSYWQAIANNHTEIKGFLYADLNKILLRLGDPTAYEYPLLVVERPSIKIDNNGVETMTSAFIIVQNTEGGNDESFNDADDLTYEIAKDILAFLKKEVATNIKIESPNEHLLEPIDSLTLNSEVGYRHEFKLNDSTSEAGLCYNALKWD